MDKTYLDLLSKWCEANGLEPDEDEYFDHIGYDVDEDSIGLVFEIDGSRYNMYVNLALNSIGLYNVVLEEYYGGESFRLDSKIIREDLSIEGLELLKSWFASNTSWTSMPVPEE